jgi:hypothetical protein
MLSLPSPAQMRSAPPLPLMLSAPPETDAWGYEAHVMEGGSEAWVVQGLSFTTPDGQPGRVA